MNVKTMEGLAGADASIRMMSIPVNVAREAERKGETDKMQRALGYAAELTEQAQKYGEETTQGMEQEAKEAREQEKLRQENQIQERRTERQEQERQTGSVRENVSDIRFDSLTISGEGKTAAEAAEQAAAQTKAQAAAGDIKPIQDVSYDRSGEGVKAVEISGANVDINV